MLEFLFFLYLISGFLKGVLGGYEVELPVDFTLLTGSAALLYSLFGTDHQNWWKRVRERILEGRSLLLLLGLFFLWSLFSTLFITPSADYAYWKCVVLLTNLLAFVVPLLSPDFNIRRFVKWLCGFSVLYGLFTFFAYGLNRLDMLQLLMMSKPSSLLEVLYLQTALLLGVSAFLAFYLGKRWGFVLMNLIAFLLLATAARGPILFYFLSLLGMGGYYVYTRRKGRMLSFRDIRLPFLSKRALMVLAGNLILIGVISSSELLRAPYERTLARYEHLIPSISEKTGQDRKKGNREGVDGVDGIAKGEEFVLDQPKRLKEYKFAIKKSLEDPLYFTVGYGFGSFNLLMYGEDKRGYPHNVFLEVMFELGLIGLLIILLFFALVIYRGIKRKRVVLLFAILFVMMNILKSYSIVDLRLLFGILSIVAFIPPLKREPLVQGSDPV